MRFVKTSLLLLVTLQLVTACNSGSSSSSGSGSNSSNSVSGGSGSTGGGTSGSGGSTSNPAPDKATVRLNAFTEQDRVEWVMTPTTDNTNATLTATYVHTDSNGNATPSNLKGFIVTQTASGLVNYFNGGSVDTTSANVFSSATSSAQSVATATIPAQSSGGEKGVFVATYTTDNQLLSVFSLTTAYEIPTANSLINFDMGAIMYDAYNGNMLLSGDGEDTADGRDNLITRSRYGINANTLQVVSLERPYTSQALNFNFLDIGADSYLVSSNLTSQDNGSDDIKDHMFTINWVGSSNNMFNTLYATKSVIPQIFTDPAAHEWSALGYDKDSLTFLSGSGNSIDSPTVVDSFSQPDFADASLLDADNAVTVQYTDDEEVATVSIAHKEAGSAATLTQQFTLAVEAGKNADWQYFGMWNNNLRPGQTIQYVTVANTDQSKWGVMRLAKDDDGVWTATNLYTQHDSNETALANTVVTDTALNLDSAVPYMFSAVSEDDSTEFVIGQGFSADWSDPQGRIYVLVYDKNGSNILDSIDYPYELNWVFTKADGTLIVVVNDSDNKYYYAELVLTGGDTPTATFGDLVQFIP